MNTKKDPAREEAQPGLQLAFQHFDYILCAHAHATLVKFDCNSGGIQYRRFCTTCWAPIGTAIAHEIAQAEEQRLGIEAPFASLAIIHGARDCYARRARSGGPA